VLIEQLVTIDEFEHLSCLFGDKLVSKVPCYLHIRHVKNLHLVERFMYECDMFLNIPIEHNPL
jgi:hypothetical protein